jgi:hypothetical protein
MGFHKRFLPDLSFLKESRKRISSDEEFLKTYLYGADSLIGPSDSIQYLKEIEEKVYAQR